MALFTDGTISDIGDLAAHDSYVLGVASTEGIDLARKLALAQEEMSVELTTFLPRIDWYDQQFSFPSRPGLENIVVTTPLRLWHAFHTLELVYRDAYNSQLNDRYQGKWTEYRELAKWAAEKLMQAGVGIVWNPVPQAEAPELSSVPGTHPDATYYASVSWLNGNGEEGAAGLAQSLTLPASTALQIRPVNQPLNAKFWNVFVGYSPDQLSLQNGNPLPPDQAWVQTDAVQTKGRAPGSGQSPNYLQALPRVLQRG